MYRLNGRLEQGELADLFRAERVETGERLSIKLFHPRTTDAAYAKAVADTARALKAVDSQRIAHVLEVGLVRKRLAVVAEDVGRYTLGLVLQRLNTREVVLPPALALTFVLELLEVLGAAHAHGVVHGALTPGNVLVGDDGRPSIAEFGALAALQASEALRAAFAPRGRTSYRAPELKSALSEGTVAADVYAVGAMTYELLTLREASLGSAAVSTRTERLPPPSRLVRRLHSRIDPVIMRALEPTPGRRHRTCGEFAEGLRAFLAEQGGIPPREELGKFVGELFPNGVSATHLGPVPFEAPFVLEAIADVDPLDTGSLELPARVSFSGGEIDERTPTIDGLPALEDSARKTLLDLPSTAPAPPDATWVAPRGAMPAVREDEASSPDVLKRRVRSLEAFDDAPPETVEPRREPAQREDDARKTIQTFAVNFKRPDDPVIPDLEAMWARRKKNARVASVAGGFILVSTVVGMILFWYRTTPEPRAALLGYLPAPIRRELTPNPPPGPAPVGPKVKLPIFPEPRPFPPPGRNVAKSECYLPPGKGKTATVTVATKRKVKLEVDGVPVCGTASRVVLTAGRHSLRFTDGSESQTIVHDFKPGTSEKVVPFKARP